MGPDLWVNGQEFIRADPPQTFARLRHSSWSALPHSQRRHVTDMADIVELMLATGGRIGEVLALRWADVALGAAPPHLTINGTIKTEPGRGT